MKQKHEEKTWPNVTVDEASVFYWADGKAETRISGHDSDSSTTKREIWFEAIAPVPAQHIINAKGKTFGSVFEFLGERHRALKYASHERVNLLLGMPNTIEVVSPRKQELRLLKEKDREILNATSIEDINATVTYTIP